MQSILDTNDSWFLERLMYTDHLSLVLAEGVRIFHPEKSLLARSSLAKDAQSTLPTKAGASQLRSKMLLLISFRTKVLLTVTNMKKGRKAFCAYTSAPGILTLYGHTA